jgi:hypothetical protein
VEAVANDDFAALEGRSDDFLHVLRATGGEKKKLRLGDKTVSLRGVLQKMADLVARGRAAWFARGEARMPGLLQPCGKAADLRGFAAALGSLESDK